MHSYPSGLLMRLLSSELFRLVLRSRSLLLISSGILNNLALRARSDLVYCGTSVIRTLKELMLRARSHLVYKTSYSIIRHLTDLALCASIHLV